MRLLASRRPDLVRSVPRRREDAFRALLTSGISRKKNWQVRIMKNREEKLNENEVV